MAILDMSVYLELKNEVIKAEKENAPLSVKMKDIKRDLKKRIVGRKARIVILIIWAVVLAACALIAAGVINLGGSVAVEPGSTPPANVDPAITWAMIPALFVPATWTLCFVGFPIGWNWTKQERKDAKNQVMVSHRIDENGYIETKYDSVTPKLSTFIWSVLMGCLTMVFSIPIAIVQCFTWKKDIKEIKSLIERIEANPLFVCE